MSLPAWISSNPEACNTGNLNRDLQFDLLSDKGGDGEGGDGVESGRFVVHSYIDVEFDWPPV